MNQKEWFYQSGVNRTLPPLDPDVPFKRENGNQSTRTDSPSRQIPSVKRLGGSSTQLNPSTKPPNHQTTNPPMHQSTNPDQEGHSKNPNNLNKPEQSPPTNDSFGPPFFHGRTEVRNRGVRGGSWGAWGPRPVGGFARRSAGPALHAERRGRGARGKGPRVRAEIRRLGCWVPFLTPFLVGWCLRKLTKQRKELVPTGSNLSTGGCSGARGAGNETLE